jgi:hypothetical protein
MSISRKHFQRIADIISTVEDEEIRNKLSLDFSVYFKDENKNFKIDRFLEACRPNKS